MQVCQMGTQQSKRQLESNGNFISDQLCGIWVAEWPPFIANVLFKIKLLNFATE